MWWLGFLCLCMVLVLIGSWLFAPTFLLRLTTHETTSHMVTNPHCLHSCMQQLFWPQSNCSHTLISVVYQTTVLQTQLCCFNSKSNYSSLFLDFSKIHGPKMDAATTLLVRRLWSQKLSFLIWMLTPKVKQSVAGWTTHVAGTTSGHFTVTTVHKQWIHFKTMGN